MRAVDIIAKKRDGKTLNQEEILWFVENYTRGDLPDYQASALLMAIIIRGMEREEIFYLTKAMANSGEQLDLSDIIPYSVDKHSSGGVGDKTTLVLVPLLASAGLPMAKLSGRGLEHTGGTLDKLEAIPGFNVNLSQADFVAQMMGQDTIYFDTDKYNIDGADQAALQAQAAWLNRYPAKRITLEGHCDERGTREYNLALGERRANAAKNYLASLGVDPARITTVSYGKERPVALESTEEAWARNRRAVTVTID